VFVRRRSSVDLSRRGSGPGQARQFVSTPFCTSSSMPDDPFGGDAECPDDRLHAPLIAPRDCPICRTGAQ